MATKKYIVKLTPHDKFFFGGENTFGEGRQANYFVKSNYFPQQTGVLGFIRHQLLLQCGKSNIFENNKIQNKEEVGKLIGKQSFRTNEEFNFGAIKALSPVFICDKSEQETDEAYFFPANKEYYWHKKLDKDCNEVEIKNFLEISLNNIPELLGYDAKFGLPDLFVNKKSKRLKYKSVFSEHQQVGIRKKYEGGTDDKAYYMQTFMKFKKNFCFAFIIELEENATFKEQDIVTFGGEQQAFRMDVTDFENKEFKELIPDYKKSKKSDKIVLVSDAYVTDDIIDKCEFAITETVDFRFLETITEKDGNYYKNPSKSKKFNLYKKGSVFYYKDDKQKKEIEECLTNAQFKNLGYNYFKIITKQQ